MALVLAATAAAGWSGRARTRGQPGWAVWGIASAAFYGGFAYVLRKMALLHLPAPAFGALIGAATGLVWYPFASFSPTVRRSLRHALQPPGPWQMAAAVQHGTGADRAIPGAGLDRCCQGRDHRR